MSRVWADSDSEILAMKKGFFQQESKRKQPALQCPPLQNGSNQNVRCTSQYLQNIVSESSKNMLKLGSNQVEGRFLEALCSFAAGDVLLTADYFATVSDQSNPELCTRCLCRCAKRERCAVCGCTFCSKTCKDLSSAGLRLSNITLNVIFCKA